MSRSRSFAADDADLARDALVRVRRVLAAQNGEDQPVRFTVEADAESVTVPRAAVDLLVKVLANMAAGQGVTVVPSHAELTTQQAADVLNVSRPFVIKLLDEGKIDYRTVGTHRRITAASLMEFKRSDDARRRGAAAELAAMTQEMGLT